MQGRVLANRYQLAEEIGNGGMGSVFRAKDLRTGGQVAVKIPHPFLARDPDYTARLSREAKIVALLNSPRIVRVVDFDADDGLPFLVMEYVPGGTLADELRARGRLPTTEALTVALEIARALDAAHQAGIVHRDLKPQNIKLVEGQIKVLDFGIARVEGMAGVTAVQVFMGTPEYAAPERAEGHADIRSDIYSLGVLLYEMLAGHLPFTGLSPIAVLRKQEREPPPPLPPDILPEAAAIVLRCLAKRPEDRYATPRDLVQALLTTLRTLPQPVTVPGGALAPGNTPLLALPDTEPPRAGPVPLPTAVLDLDDAPLLDWRPGETMVYPAAASDTTPMSAVPTTVPQLTHRTPLTLPHAATRPVLRTLQTAVATPARRALLAGSSIAAAVGIGLMIWMLVRNGGDTRAGTPAAVVGALTPSTATAAPALATVVHLPPATPAVTPVRPLRVAEIPLETAATTEERNLIRTLNEANRAEVLAYRNADTTGLDAYFTGPALREITSVIGNMKRQGRYGIADLKQITLLSLIMDGPDRATMETREVQDYDELYTTSNEGVPEPELHRKDDVYRWTYRLVKQESRWLIESKIFRLAGE